MTEVGAWLPAEVPASIGLVRVVVFVSAVVALGIIDLKRRLLPNAIVLPAGLIGLPLSIVAYPEWWWMYPASALGVAGALFVVATACPGGMGMGDVKMGGMLGAFLGPYAFLAVFLGSLVGAVVGALLLISGAIDRRTPLPFGTFMSLGGLLAAFFGQELWAGYVDALRWY